MGGQVKIRQVEDNWIESQEKQRDKDDALVNFIRTARERRDGERELERQDLAALERKHANAQKFYELGGPLRARLLLLLLLLLPISTHPHTNTRARTHTHTYTLEF
jgi:hypothetical protein